MRVGQITWHIANRRLIFIDFDSAGTTFNPNSKSIFGGAWLTRDLEAWSPEKGLTVAGAGN